MTPSILKNVVRLPKQRAKQVRARISYMTSEQLERFLKTAKAYGSREHAMFLFAVAHGARAQEIANLRINDINFGNEQIHIARLKGSLASTQNLLKVKGNALFDEKTALKAWLAVREADADNFVFNSQKSTQLNRITVYKMFKAIAKKAGLGETLQHPHVLKHTAAMLMVQQGANAFLIRQHLGHRSFDSTLAYVNPSDSERLGQGVQSDFLAGYKVTVLLHSGSFDHSIGLKEPHLFLAQNTQQFFRGQFFPGSQLPRQVPGRQPRSPGRPDTPNPG